MINAVKAALWTTAQTFIGSILLLSVGWLADVAKWASANGQSPLPGLSTIGYAVVGAAVAAMSGLVTLVIRVLQVKVPAIPGSPPEYPTPVTPTADNPPVEQP